MSDHALDSFAGGLESFGTFVSLPPEVSSSREPHPALSHNLKQYVSEAGLSADERMLRLSGALGLQLVSLIGIELAHERGLHDLRDLRLHVDELSRAIGQRVPGTEWRRCFKNLEPAVAHNDYGSHPVPDLNTSLDYIQWLLSGPDLGVLTQHLDGFGLNARTTFEQTLSALREFVTRHRAQPPKYRLIGQLFEQGHIDVRQAAELLELSIPDTLEHLDAGGYARPAGSVKVDRDAIYARLAKARDQSTAWWNTTELARRDVLSNQRLESIDARDH